MHLRSKQYLNDHFGTFIRSQSTSIPRVKRAKYINSELLTNMFFCCIGNKERKGVKDSNTLRSKVTSSKGAGLWYKRDKHTPKLAFPHRSLTKNICDFSCQSSSQSNHSLEIKSQALSKSVSQHSSVQSIFSIKWRRRFRRYEKQPSIIQSVLYSLAKKFRGNKKKRNAAEKYEKKNVLVLHVPKNFSNTSTVGTASTTRNSSKVEKPIIIRDESSQAITIEPTKPHNNKICGPGEVLVKQNTTMFAKYDI